MTDTPSPHRYDIKGRVPSRNDSSSLRSTAVNSSIKTNDNNNNNNPHNHTNHVDGINNISSGSSGIKFTVSTSTSHASHPSDARFHISLQSKVNELFLQWLSNSDSQNVLRQALERVKQTGRLSDTASSSTTNETTAFSFNDKPTYQVRGDQVGLPCSSPARHGHPPSVTVPMPSSGQLPMTGKASGSLAHVEYRRAGLAGVGGRRVSCDVRLSSETPIASRTVESQRCRVQGPLQSVNHVTTRTGGGEVVHIQINNRDNKQQQSSIIRNNSQRQQHHIQGLSDRGLLTHSADRDSSNDTRCYSNGLFSAVTTPNDHLDDVEAGASKGQSVSNLISKFSQISGSPREDEYQRKERAPSSPTIYVPSPLKIADVIPSEVVPDEQYLAVVEKQPKDAEHKDAIEDKQRLKVVEGSDIIQEKIPDKIDRYTPTANKAYQSAAPIPKFYFPFGKPKDSDGTRLSGCLAEAWECVAAESKTGEGQTVALSEMADVAKALEIPLYWKILLYRACGGRKKDPILWSSLVSVWTEISTKFHDEPSRFIHLLCYHRKNDIAEPCDWELLILDIVNTHPGLKFLKEAKEFISRYCKTVIARIYFTVSRSFSDSITLRELRCSNLLESIANLEIEEDINKFVDYFSYEHFYVIYCKFWEIDTDHDLFVSKEDMYKHNQNAISRRVINRIFDGAVSNSEEIKKGLMSYYEFVWFLIAEEDKKSKTSIEYWFRCMDLDGDGYISMFEMEYFYQEQIQRLEMYSFEYMQIEDVTCQMLDIIKPAEKNKIRLADLKKCKLVDIFFDTFINIEKFLEHDQRDPFASLKGSDVQEVSDWVRYAAEEYDNLVSDEHGGNDDRQDYGDGNGDGIECFERDDERSHEAIFERHVPGDEQEQGDGEDTEDRLLQETDPVNPADVQPPSTMTEHGVMAFGDTRATVGGQPSHQTSSVNMSSL